MFLFKLVEKTGEARKLARPFHRIVELDTNTATILRVDRPEAEPLLVVVERLRRCPEEMGTEFWPPDKRSRRNNGKAAAHRPQAGEAANGEQGVVPIDPSTGTEDVMTEVESDLPASDEPDATTDTITYRDRGYS